MIAILAPTATVVLLTLGSLGPGDGEGCFKCDKRGVVPCPEHSEEIHAMEPDVLFCSVVAECEQCAGALLIDCKKCKGGPDDHLIPERQAVVAKWMETQPMSDYLGRNIPNVETERFQLIIDTGPLKLERKKTLDGHMIMHLVARDVRQVRQLVDEHYLLEGSKARAIAKEGKTEEEAEAGGMEASHKKEYGSKMRMWIWKDPKDHQKVMAEFLLSGSTGDFKMLGRKPVFSVWTEDYFSTVPDVRRLFTHNSSHMLLSNLYEPLWTGDTGGGWFDAAAGHWYEYAVHGLSVNYCIEEATLPLDFHGGLWRAPIRKWLGKEKEYFLPKLLPKPTGALTLPEQALCWSFYDWMVAEHVGALPLIQQGLKRGEESRDLLRETLGMSLFKAEDAWRAWVKVTYPKKGDVPRKPKKKKKR